MATGDLTTIEDLRTYLAIKPSDNAADAIFALLISAASRFIKSYCDQDFLEQEYDLVTDGKGMPSIILPNYPVNSVSSVRVNGQEISERGASGAGYSFNPRTGTIKLVGSIFERGTDNVEITYNAGYAFDELPYDIRFACTKLAAYRYKERDRLGKAAEGFNGQTVSYRDDVAPQDILNTLKNYKRGFPTC